MVAADAGRQLVAERGLTVAAVGALIPLMSGVGFEDLGLVKALLKRFFSDGPWTAMDAAALATAVGRPPADAGDGDGDGVWVTRHDLDGDLTLVAGWVDGTFLVDVEVGSAGPVEENPVRRSLDLSRTFASGVVPQPTPNPRTLRFATARRAMGASESFQRDNRSDDERVAAIFAVADDVVDVLVGADFVAVSIVRPGRWPELLEPMLDVVASTFGGDTSDVEGPDEVEPSAVDVRGVAHSGAPAAPTKDRQRSRLDRAWDDLGRLEANEPDDLELVLAAARDTDSARRQVAAQLLSDAPDVVAASTWSELLVDPSRTVRRAAVDAVVGAERETLRPLLERATTDSDAWIRWKALHGLAVLGVGPSLPAIERLHDDPDFRVRLEAANARRGAAGAPPEGDATAAPR